MTVNSQLDASLHFPSAPPPTSERPVAQMVRRGFSHLPLLRCVYLGLHRGQHASRLKANKQPPPQPTPCLPPSWGVYVGTTDSICALHRLHRATLRLTNGEKTAIGNVPFEPSHKPFIYLLSSAEQQ